MISRKINLSGPLLTRGVPRDHIVTKSAWIGVRAMQVIIDSINSTKTVASRIAICAVTNQRSRLILLFVKTLNLDLV